MIDRNSSTWRFIEDWAKGTKSALTDELIEKDSEQTRGRIKQLDDLLGLPHQKPGDKLPIVEYT
jgi:hypothetical protein